MTVRRPRHRVRRPASGWSACRRSCTCARTRRSSRRARDGSPHDWQRVAREVAQGDGVDRARGRRPRRPPALPGLARFRRLTCDDAGSSGRSWREALQVPRVQLSPDVIVQMTCGSFCKTRSAPPDTARCPPPTRANELLMTRLQIRTLALLFAATLGAAPRRCSPSRPHRGRRPRHQPQAQAAQLSAAINANAVKLDTLNEQINAAQYQLDQANTTIADASAHRRGEGADRRAAEARRAAGRVDLPERHDGGDTSLFNVDPSELASSQQYTAAASDQDNTLVDQLNESKASLTPARRTPRTPKTTRRRRRRPSRPPRRASTPRTRSTPACSAR